MEQIPGREANSRSVSKFSALYGTRRFVTVFTRACHRALSWARWIQSTHILRSTLILLSHQQQGFFTPRFPTKIIISMCNTSEFANSLCLILTTLYPVTRRLFRHGSLLAKTDLSDLSQLLSHQHADICPVRDPFSVMTRRTKLRMEITELCRRDLEHADLYLSVICMTAVHFTIVVLEFFQMILRVVILVQRMPLLISNHMTVYSYAGREGTALTVVRM
jgi:hypothetical protein